MNADSRANTPSRQGSTSFVAVVLVLLLVIAPLLYALSIGPAVVLLNWGTIDQEQLNFAYAPIRYVHYHFKGSRPLIEAYVQIWLQLAGIQLPLDEAP
jgi:hypothetical protein